ncbi:hypothetical protein [Burkholderia stagnalis]
MKPLPGTMQAVTGFVDGVSSACVVAQGMEVEAGDDGGWRVEQG